MEKTFDCLKMKEELQAIVYEKTKDMTYPELRAYFDESLKDDALWQRLLSRDKKNRRSVVKNVSLA